MGAQNGNGTKPDEDTILFNCQVNYYIINGIWKYVQRQAGGNNQPGVKDLYKKIGLTGRIYSGILTEKNINLERKWNSLKVMNVPKEYMMGEKMIPLKGIEEKEWRTYFEYKDKKHRGEKLPAEEEMERQGKMRNFRAIFNASIRTLTGETEEPADLIYFYCKENRPKTMKVSIEVKAKKLIELLNELTAPDWVKCSDEIRKEVLGHLKKQYEMVKIIEQYNKITK